MRLSRIFVDVELEPGREVLLPAEKGHYVKNVLRLQNFHPVVLFNGQHALDYVGEIFYEGKQVKSKIDSVVEKKNDSSADICLIQAVGKSDHMDFLIQKGTELGASRFIVFNALRTQSPLKGARLEKRLKHWYGITISACEQSNRNLLPGIEFLPDLTSCIQQSTSANQIILDFKGKSFNELKAQLDVNKKFSLLTGCEGGLADSEIQLAISSGFLSCVSGPRTLRMETAAISMLAIIQHHFGDMI